MASRTERTRVEPILLGVEVRHKKWRPVRDPTLEDFRLKLDLRDWPIHSVDGVCDPDMDTAAFQATAAPAVTPPADPGAGIEDARQGRRFVLYFDFSQLQQAGRSRALRAARDWL